MIGEGASRALRRLATGLYALGVRGSAETAYATTLSWLIPISFEPPMLGVALEPDSRTLALVRDSGRFALSELGAAAHADAIKLGRPSREAPNKMRGVTLGESHNGLPVVAQGLSWLECRVTAEHRVGDHILVIAEVEAGWVGDNLEGPEWSYWG